MLRGPIADQTPLQTCFVATNISAPESLPFLVCNSAQYQCIWHGVIGSPDG